MSIFPAKSGGGDEKRWFAGEVYALLAQTVGEEKAQTVIDAAARALGLDTARGLTMDEVLEVLDRVAAEPGIVGITARFAKSRVHLGG